MSLFSQELFLVDQILFQTNIGKESGLFVVRICIQEFLQDREFQDLPRYTIKMYRQNLSRFPDYCTEKGVSNVEDVPSSMVRVFLVQSKAEGNKPSTLNNKLRSIKVFFDFLVNEDILNAKRNPAVKLKSVKEDMRIEVLSDKQIRAILNYYERFSFRNNSLNAYRSRMIIIFLLSIGVRREELVNLKRSDIDFKSPIY